MTIETVYSIPSPYTTDGTIEVYGEPENAWYEWRILNADGKAQQDTGREGDGRFRGRQYGQAEVALRDALMVDSGLPDPFIENMRKMDARIKAKHGPQQ